MRSGMLETATSSDFGDPAGVDCNRFILAAKRFLDERQ
jgi:hypothetical protein